MKTLALGVLLSLALRDHPPALSGEADATVSRSVHRDR